MTSTVGKVTRPEQKAGVGSGCIQLLLKKPP